MKAAIYARVSTKNHGQDTDTQLLPLRQYAAARGLDIAQEYVDNGFSGSKDRRPQLDRLMKDAHQRRFDAVLVFKLDRFGRSNLAPDTVAGDLPIARHRLHQPD